MDGKLSKIFTFKLSIGNPTSKHSTNELFNELLNCTAAETETATFEIVVQVSNLLEPSKFDEKWKTSSENSAADASRSSFVEWIVEPVGVKLPFSNSLQVELLVYEPKKSE